jgi:hypothetical protein
MHPISHFYELRDTTFEGGAPGFRSLYDDDTMGQPRHFAAAVWVRMKLGSFAPIANEIREFGFKSGSVRDWFLTDAGYRMYDQLRSGALALTDVRQYILDNICWR